MTAVWIGRVTYGDPERAWLNRHDHYLHNAAEVAAWRGMVALIAYHDRTRHTGTIYRKAGFRRDGGHLGVSTGWASRPGRAAGDVGATPKRRWRLDLTSRSGEIQDPA